MGIFAAEGCGVLFQSDLIKRDLLAKRQGRLPVKPITSPRFLHSRAAVPGDEPIRYNSAEHVGNLFLDTFLSRPATSSNVRITSLRSVIGARREQKAAIEGPGLNFVWKSAEHDEPLPQDARAVRSPRGSRSVMGAGGVTDRFWERRLPSAVPRGSKAHDRREMAFVANLNTLVKPYKEQNAAAFFRRCTHSHCTELLHNCWLRRTAAQ